MPNFWRLYHRYTYLNPHIFTTVVLPNDNSWNEVVKDHIQVFDDAFEDLTKKAIGVLQATAQVHTYFTEFFFCSVCGAVDWKNEAACHLKDTLLLSKTVLIQ